MTPQRIWDLGSSVFDFLSPPPRPPSPDRSANVRLCMVVKPFNQMDRTFEQLLCCNANFNGSQLGINIGMKQTHRSDRPLLQKHDNLYVLLLSHHVESSVSSRNSDWDTKHDSRKHKSWRLPPLASSNILNLKSEKIQGFSFNAASPPSNWPWKHNQLHHGIYSATPNLNCTYFLANTYIRENRLVCAHVLTEILQIYTVHKLPHRAQAMSIFKMESPWRYDRKLCKIFG